MNFVIYAFFGAQNCLMNIRKSATPPGDERRKIFLDTVTFIDKFTKIAEFNDPAQNAQKMQLEWFEQRNKDGTTHQILMVSINRDLSQPLKDRFTGSPYWAVPLQANEFLLAETETGFESVALLEKTQVTSPIFISGNGLTPPEKAIQMKFAQWCLANTDISPASISPLFDFPLDPHMPKQVQNTQKKKNKKKKREPEKQEPV